MSDLMSDRRLATGGVAMAFKVIPAAYEAPEQTAVWQSFLNRLLEAADRRVPAQPAVQRGGMP